MMRAEKVSVSLDKARRCRVEGCRTRTKMGRRSPFSTREVRICPDHWERFRAGEGLTLKPWKKPAEDVLRAMFERDRGAV